MKNVDINKIFAEKNFDSINNLFYSVEADLETRLIVYNLLIKNNIELPNLAGDITEDE